MHIPVLQKEVLEYLAPKPNENFIDCTFGSGGHTLIILEVIKPSGKVLAIDQDIETLKDIKYENRVVLICDNFVNLKKIVTKTKFGPVNGILFDLGMSSWHLDKSGRGFSFLRDEPLNMGYCRAKSETFVPSSSQRKRKTKNEKLTAEEIVNNWTEKEIEKILKEYGEERFAKRIAEKIIEKRKIKPIQSTFQLVEVIRMAVPLWYQHKRIHFATKTFQALRIVVNDELDNLKNVLPQALSLLESGGRLVVISFHSLEDRIVKHFFKNNIKSLKILTKKPIQANEEEIKTNPRSRSAKLRAIIKL